jgi:hypothetical protein
MFIDFFGDSRLYLHEKNYTYHFGLFWYIHDCQELTQQMIKKPPNPP